MSYSLESKELGELQLGEKLDQLHLGEQEPD